MFSSSLSLFRLLFCRLSLNFSVHTVSSEIDTHSFTSCVSVTHFVASFLLESEVTHSQSLNDALYKPTHMNEAQWKQVSWKRWPVNCLHRYRKFLSINTLNIPSLSRHLSPCEEEQLMHFLLKKNTKLPTVTSVYCVHFFSCSLAVHRSLHQ